MPNSTESGVQRSRSCFQHGTQRQGQEPEASRNASQAPPSRQVPPRRHSSHPRQASTPFSRQPCACTLSHRPSVRTSPGRTHATEHGPREQRAHAWTRPRPLPNVIAQAPRFRQHPTPNPYKTRRIERFHSLKDPSSPELFCRLGLAGPHARNHWRFSVGMARGLLRSRMAGGVPTAGGVAPFLDWGPACLRAWPSRRPVVENPAVLNFREGHGDRGIIRRSLRLLRECQPRVSTCIMKTLSALLAMASLILTQHGTGLTFARDKPFTDVTEYQFIRTNGLDVAGDLSLAGPNTITLTPCPLGINGTATNHPLLLDGGSGGPESPTISGGTCTSGAPSGTLRFTTASGRTGGWTLKSATAGLQEALAATAPKAAHLYVPCGTWPVVNTTLVDRSNIWIQGGGHCTLLSSNAAVPVIHVRDAQHVRVSDLAFLATVSAPESEALRATAAPKIEVVNVRITGEFHRGIHLTGDGFFANLDNIFVTGVRAAGVAIWIENHSGVTIRNSFLYSQNAPNSALAGIQVTRTSGLTVESTDITLADFCLLLDPASNGVSTQYGFFTNVLFDSCGVSGIHINPRSHGVVRGMYFMNTWTSANRVNGITITKTGGSSVVDGIHFVGHRSISNVQAGLLIDGSVSNIRFLSGTVAGNSIQAVDTYDGISIANGASHIMIRDSRIGPSDGQRGHMRYGIHVEATAGNFISIQGNDLSGNATGPLLFLADRPNVAVTNNVGINDAVFPTIASASSITIPVGPDNIIVAGTTAIQTINGGYIGRTVNLMFNDPSPAGIIAGGNVYISHPAIQNRTIQLIFDGVGWR